MFQGSLFARDAQLNMTLYPALLPAGQWRLDYELYTKNSNDKQEPLLTMQQFFEVKNIGTIQY